MRVAVLSFCLPYMGREETAWGSAPTLFFVFFVGEEGSLLHRFGTHALRGRRRHKAASTSLFFVVRRDLCVLFSFASLSSLALLRGSFP